jgi:hypothetical protein
MQTGERVAIKIFDKEQLIKIKDLGNSIKKEISFENKTYPWSRKPGRCPKALSLSLTITRDYTIDDRAPECSKTDRGAGNQLENLYCPGIGQRGRPLRQDPPAEVCTDIEHTRYDVW